MVRIGLPKNKHLKTACNAFLKAQGMTLEPKAERRDFTTLRGNGFEGLACYYGQSSILKKVSQGQLAAGIVGLDKATEFNLSAARTETESVCIVGGCGVATCTLNIAIGENETDTSLSTLNGRRFATTYPEILESYLALNGIAHNGIIVEDGSVEMSYALGDVEAIMDIVDSGESLKANGLKSIATVLPVEAVMIIPQPKPIKSQSVSGLIRIARAF